MDSVLPSDESKKAEGVPSTILEDGHTTLSYPSTMRNTLSFIDNDPENPYNWPWAKKLYIVMTAVLLVLNSTVSSAIASNAMVYIAADFGIVGDIQMYLPVTLYLIGYIFGPLMFGPLSEAIGRKPVTFWSFNIFIIFTVACALAPNWTSFLIFRLICGTCGSVPLTVIGGLYADIFESPKTRGRAMICFMSGTTFGPIGGPIISGYLAPFGWRWCFWTALIFTGCTWIPAVLLPETYAPIILMSKAKRLRKSFGNEDIFAPIELENKIGKDFLIVTLLRPVSMLCYEPLVYLNCLYIALLYAFFYLFFEAYPIIFEGIYGFSKGESGLALSPIGLGAALSGPVLVYYDTVFERAQKRQEHWVLKEEFRRLPVACIGGPFCVIGLFWLAWSARPDVHWAMPCLSGLFFGFGYLCIFTALINYLVDSYHIYAASAMAASSFARSVLGATLPFAAKPLYQHLGVAWATSLLGFLSLALVFIPYALILFGPKIRANSKMCQIISKQKRGQINDEEEGGVQNGEEDLQ